MLTDSDEEETFYDEGGAAPRENHEVPRSTMISQPSLEIEGEEESEAEAVRIAVPSPSLKSQHIPARTTEGKADKGGARKRSSLQRYDLTSFNGISTYIQGEILSDFQRMVLAKRENMRIEKSMEFRSMFADCKEVESGGGKPSGGVHATLAGERGERNNESQEAVTLATKLGIENVFQDANIIRRRRLHGLVEVRRKGEEYDSSHLHALLKPSRPDPEDGGSGGDYRNQNYSDRDAAKSVSSLYHNYKEMKRMKEQESMKGRLVPTRPKTAHLRERERELLLFTARTQPSNKTLEDATGGNTTRNSNPPEEHPQEEAVSPGGTSCKGAPSPVPRISGQQGETAAEGGDRRLSLAIDAAHHCIAPLTSSEVVRSPRWTDHRTKINNEYFTFVKDEFMY